MLPNYRKLPVARMSSIDTTQPRKQEKTFCSFILTSFYRNYFHENKGHDIVQRYTWFRYLHSCKIGMTKKSIAVNV